MNKRSLTVLGLCLLLMGGFSGSAISSGKSQFFEEVSKTYKGTVTWSSGETDVVSTFVTEGDTLVGTWKYNEVSGNSVLIEANVDERELLFEITSGSWSGRLLVSFTENCNSFTGTWGNNISDNDGGSWNGTSDSQSDELCVKNVEAEGPGVPQSEEGEIVINKKGQSVLLKDDNTWEIIDTSGFDNKVVFTIIDAQTKWGLIEKKDDFGDVEHLIPWAGCEYKMSAKNNTKHKVKIGDVEAYTTSGKIYSEWYGFNAPNVARMSFGLSTILEPGQTAESKKIDFWTRTIFKITEKRLNPQETLSSGLKAEIQKNYGCDALSGTLYLRNGTYDDIVIFPKGSGISKKEIEHYVIGNPDGLYPLYEKVYF